MNHRMSRLFRSPNRRWIWVASAVLVLAAGVAIVLTQIDPSRLTGTVGEQPTATPGAAGPAQNLINGPLVFVENVGQFSDTVRFQAPGGNRTLWLTGDAFWVTVLPTSSASGGQPVNLAISFPGANANPALEAFDALDTSVSYFVGNNAANWHAGVPVWGGVRYKDLYPGIDLEMVGAYSQWQPRLVARSGANLDAVRMHIEGADSLTLEGDQLRLSTAAGDLIMPLLAADEDGSPSVTVDHDILSPYAYVPALPLDQQTTGAGSTSSDLLYSTFLVGDHKDWGNSIAVDGMGSAYITGETNSTNFPSSPGASGTAGSSLQDLFVAKLNATGTALEYFVLLGGSSDDWGADIAIDGTGNAYVTGGTRSGDFPATAGAYDTACGLDGSCDSAGLGIPNDDAFVIKLDPTGLNLAYATFLGGSGSEGGAGIAIDDSGRAYVVGSTQSSNFPTTSGALDTSHGGLSDGFVVRLNAAGSDLEYGTFLGGGGNDIAEDIAVYENSAFVTGSTFSPGFSTTPGAFITTHTGLYGAFVTKLSADGATLVYSTFLSASALEYGRAIAVDSTGSAYVTGEINSDGLPTTPGAYDSVYHGQIDGFVVKLNPDGSDLLHATFLGGSDRDRGYSIALDAAGNAYITGDTESSDFPTTPDGVDTSYNGSTSSNRGDVFFVKLESDGSDLVYATFLGGSGGDVGRGIDVDTVGDAYVTGYTNSGDFPITAGAFNAALNGCTTCDDAFVIKLRSPAAPAVAYSISGQVVDASGRPLSDVTITDHKGNSALTDSNGNYELDELLAGAYTVTLSAGGKTFPSTTRAIDVPPSATNQDFVLLPEPVCTDLTPEAAGTLTFTSTQGLPTQLTFPTGTVAHTTTLCLTPTLTAAQAGAVLIGDGFEVAAYQDGVLQPDFAFGQPVTVDLRYSGSDVQPVSDQAQLLLQRWTGTQWVDVAEECTPPASYDRLPAENRVSISICSTGQFALFGPTHQLHVPFLLLRR
jgi:hypothetical protein